MEEEEEQGEDKLTSMAESISEEIQAEKGVDLRKINACKMGGSRMDYLARSGIDSLFPGLALVHFPGFPRPPH